MKGIMKFFLIFIGVMLIIAVMAYIGIAMLIISIITLLISSIIGFNKSKKMVATEMKCPNCGSEEIKIQSKRVGTSTTTSISGIGNSIGFNFLGFHTLSSGNATANSNENYKFQREGICQSCGYNYDYITQKEIDKTQKDSQVKLIVAIVLFIILLIMSVLGALDSRTKSNNENDNNIWAVEYTNIDDFDYYLDGDKIYLKEYEGKDKKIRINNQYTINGNVYTVESFADAVFVFSDVTSVILPDSLISMPNNTFNSSDLEYIYIPASLLPDGESYSFYDYFHDIEIIYYGGTEEQWKFLTNNANREDIDAKEIRYNVNVEDLIQVSIKNKKVD